MRHKFISFETGEFRFIKGYSDRDCSNFYMQYTQFNEYLASPKVISRSKFYSELRKAKARNIKITTNSKTKINGNGKNN